MSLGRLTDDLRRIRTSLVGYRRRVCALLAPSAACTSSVRLGRPMNCLGTTARPVLELVGREEAALARQIDAAELVALDGEVGDRRQPAEVAAQDRVAPQAQRAGQVERVL